MPEIVTTPAIVLQRWDFSETSFVVALFTRDLGKVRALAKGAKRARSPLQGGLEPVTLGEMTVYRKPPPAMNIVSQALTSEYWRELRRDLSRFYAAHYVAELCLRLVPDDVPDPDLFEHAAGAFRRLDSGGRVEAVTLSFEAGLLRRSGVLPRPEACMGCGKPWKERDRAAFHAPSGGAFCPACAAARRLEGTPVSAGTLRLLEQFGQDRVPHPERVSLAPAALSELRRVLDECFRTLLEGELRSRKFLGAGGPGPPRRRACEPGGRPGPDPGTPPARRDGRGSRRP